MYYFALFGCRKFVLIKSFKIKDNGGGGGGTHGIIYKVRAHAFMRGDSTFEVYGYEQKIKKKLAFVDCVVFIKHLPLSIFFFRVVNTPDVSVFGFRYCFSFISYLNKEEKNAIWYLVKDVSLGLSFYRVYNNLIITAEHRHKQLRSNSCLFMIGSLIKSFLISVSKLSLRKPQKILLCNHHSIISSSKLTLLEPRIIMVEQGPIISSNFNPVSTQRCFDVHLTSITFK